MIQCKDSVITSSQAQLEVWQVKLVRTTILALQMENQTLKCCATIKEKRKKCPKLKLHTHKLALVRVAVIQIKPHPITKSIEACLL